MRPDLDFEAVGQVLRDVAAQEICPRFRNLSDEAISTKTHASDLVTIADVRAEAALSERLTRLLPGSVTLGEEAVYADPEIKARLGGDAPVWIIDPVDGTANFARGNPEFAVIVALVESRKTVAGWIYDPMRGRMFTAERGGGVWSEGEGRRLRMRQREGRDLSALTGCIGKRLAERHGHLFAGITRQGSAAHDYMAMVDGRLDFRLFRLLNPWDHAAGVLMVEEAGGCARLLTETPYTPEFHVLASGLMIAPDAETWAELRIALGV